MTSKPALHIADVAKALNKATLWEIKTRYLWINETERFYYVKNLHQKACRTCSTIIFLHSTNEISDLWRCCCRCRRQIFNYLIDSLYRGDNHLISNKHEGDNCFIKNAPKILDKSSRLYFVRRNRMGNVQIIFKSVNCLNLHCFCLTNTDAEIVKMKCSSFYLEIFSCHILWLSWCSLVLRFLIVQWLPLHSTTVRSDFRWRPLFLEGKFLSSFLNLNWRVRLPYLELMVYWLLLSIL